MPRSAGAQFVFAAAVALVMFIITMPCAASQAEITFTGEQDGYFETGKYLATGTITVKRGKTLSFAPGCEVRFKQFTGIVVEGTLKCVGWASQPVVFTSENSKGNLTDAHYKPPAPFDWNGIVIADSQASLELENVHIAYSTYGLDIKSASSKVTLKSVIFSENGKSGITISDNALGVIDNEQFSYVQPEAEKALVVDKNQTTSDAKVESIPTKKVHWKSPLRFTFGAIALAGAALGVYERLQADKNDRLYYQNAGTIADDYRQKRDNASTLSLVCFGIAIAGASGFSLTFFF